MFNKSKVVIGTWPLSGDLGEVDKKEVYATLEYCAKMGLVEFDTAPNYGRGGMESIIGKVFKGEKNITINTKCGSSINNKKDFSKGSLRSSLYQSLERLGCDRIGTLFLHNPRNEIKNWKSLKDFFEKEKVDGSIISSGLSLAKDYTYDMNDLEYFDAFQNDLNLLYLKPLTNKKV